MSARESGSIAFLACLPLLGLACASGGAGNPITALDVEPVPAAAPATDAQVALATRDCKPPPSHAFYVLTEDPLHPRVRYDDGQVSTNDSCMIRLGSKLNRKMPPAYVNGMPLGFC